MKPRPEKPDPERPDPERPDPERPDPEVTVVGVDFSGAASDDRTWVSLGRLRRGVLELSWCRPVGREELAGLLCRLPGDAVAALDFPFSVPQGFAAAWRPGATAMPQLWEAVAGMDFAGFMELRDRFVASSGEQFRIGDLYIPGCFSCLHKANPNMMPMTFQGMRMLSSLWRAGCRVPPLPEEGQDGPLLLESMPGAALRALGLPFKGYKTGAKAGQLRRRILDGLAGASGVRLGNLATFEAGCMASDDCLDSVVAAVTAALWVQDESAFRKPQDRPVNLETVKDELGHAVSSHRRSRTSLPCENELAAARLEGWLYAPRR